MPSSNPRSSGARKTATIKKRKVQRFLAIASLFRKKNRSHSGSSCGSSDAGDDERTAVATAVGVNTGGNNNNNNGHLRGFTRSESTELASAARRSQGGGGFAGWLWRTVTRQRGRMGGSTGRRSPASSVSGGWSPLPPVGARNSARHGGERKASSSQQAPPQHRASARQPRSTSRVSGSSGQGSHHHQGSGSGGCGPAVVGGCITQFYDAPAADENDTVAGCGGADLTLPSAEEAAEARARVQQLLRTSQVHMNKHSSMRSGSFAADMLSGVPASAPSATVAGGIGGGGGVGH